MPIRRSTNQSSDSLETFYESEEWTGALKKISDKMLGLINWINESFVDTELIAWTSHQRLCIQGKDNGNSESNWKVIISFSLLDEYEIEYLVPFYKSPWKNAWMRGTAKNLTEAKTYLIKSMIETEEWSKNAELKKLLNK